MSRLRAVSAAGSAQNLDTQDPTVIDCAEPAALAAFWCGALGYAAADTHGETAVIVDPAGVGPRLRFRQARPSPTLVDRPQLELEVTGGGPLVRHRALVEAEVARLVELGARVVGRVPGDPDRYGVVLADPEGNEFSVG
jgi:hypothetical protein